MVDPTDLDAAERLDREGRRLVTIGAVVGGPLAAASTLLIAWFITYFADGSGSCELACQTGNPVWWIAAVLILLEVFTLARMIRGGAIALVIGGLTGLGAALLGVAFLSRGGHGAIAMLYLVAVIGSCLALALGAAARLWARSGRQRGGPRRPTARSRRMSG